jgi:hypothetical protein
MYEVPLFVYAHGQSHVSLGLLQTEGFAFKAYNGWLTDDTTSLEFQKTAIQRAVQPTLTVGDLSGCGLSPGKHRHTLP